MSTIDPPLFRQFEATYNLLPNSTRDGFFVDLVIDALRAHPRPRTVLDIGCGQGIGTSAALLRGIRAECDEFIGIEPDASIVPPAGVFSQIHRSTFEDCTIPDGTVDSAFSCMVMEHVTDPDAFMARLSRVLKPGGSYIFMTVNGAHYFALAANALRRMRMDEAVLRAVRGTSAVEGYHYPTAYRFNDPKTIAASCRRAGLCPPRFVFAEHEGARCYFPGPSKAIWHALTFTRKVVKRPQTLLQLIGLITKP